MFQKWEEEERKRCCHQGNTNKGKYFALTSKTHSIEFSLSHSLSFEQRAHLNFNLYRLAILCQRKSWRNLQQNIFRIVFYHWEDEHRTKRSKNNHINSPFIFYFQWKFVAKEQQKCLLRFKFKNLFVLETSVVFVLRFLLFIGLKSVIIFDWVHFFIRVSRR